MQLLACLWDQLLRLLCHELTDLCQRSTHSTRGGSSLTAGGALRVLGCVGLRLGCEALKLVVGVVLVWSRKVSRAAAAGAGRAPQGWRFGNGCMCAVRVL